MRAPAAIIGWAASVVALLWRWLDASLRWRVLGRSRVDGLIARGQGFAYATLHGSSLLLLPQHLDEPLSVLVSRSDDGEWAARLLRAQGIDLVRGSSSRGSASALRGLCRAARSGRRVTLTVDGPRGPAGSVAPGIVALSVLEDLWIVPVAAACRRGISLPTWDRCRLPLPFARAAMIYGRPFKVPRDAPGPPHTAQLEGQLASLHQRARRLCDGTSGAVRPSMEAVPR